MSTGIDTRAKARKINSELGAIGITVSISGALKFLLGIINNRFFLYSLPGIICWGFLTLIAILVTALLLFHFNKRIPVIYLSGIAAGLTEYTFIFIATFLS